MAKTHPHLDDPSREQLAALVEGRPAPLVEVYLGLHELMVEALPDVASSADTVDASVGYAAHQWGYNGWGMAALTPYGKWVSLTLLQGAHLDDPTGLLTGTTTMRHIKFKDPEELAELRDAIRALVIAAARLNVP